MVTLVFETCFMYVYEYTFTTYALIYIQSLTYFKHCINLNSGLVRWCQY